MGFKASMDMWGDTRTAVALSTWRDRAPRNTEENEIRRLTSSVAEVWSMPYPIQPKAISAILGNDIPVIEKSMVEHDYQNIDFKKRKKKKKIKRKKKKKKKEGYDMAEMTG